MSCIFWLQAELEAQKREAARKSPEPRRREGGAPANKSKGSSEAREAALKAELDVTAEALAASKQEAQALSDGLGKANALIEVQPPDTHVMPSLTIACCPPSVGLSRASRFDGSHNEPSTSVACWGDSMCCFPA